MADDVDGRRRVIDERFGDIVQRAVEARLNGGAVDREGDVRRHGQLQLVADAVDFDTGPGGRFLQLALLLVHVAAHGGPCDGADSRADGGVTLVVTAGHHAGTGAEDGTGRAARQDALAGAGLAGLQEQRQRHGRDEDHRLVHEVTPFS